MTVRPALSNSFSDQSRVWLNRLSREAGKPDCTLADIEDATLDGCVRNRVFDWIWPASWSGKSARPGRRFRAVIRNGAPNFRDFLPDLSRG